MNMTKLFTGILLIASISANAADLCSPRLKTIAMNEIINSGFKPDETFNFNIEALNPPHLKEVVLKSYAVQGSDQVGPSFWLMVLNTNTCKVEFFGLTYQE